MTQRVCTSPSKIQNSKFNAASPRLVDLHAWSDNAESTWARLASILEVASRMLLFIMITAKSSGRMDRMGLGTKALVKTDFIIPSSVHGGLYMMQCVLQSYPACSISSCIPVPQLYLQQRRQCTTYATSSYKSVRFPDITCSIIARS